MKWERQRFIEAQSGCEYLIISIEIRRTPVVSERRVESPRLAWVHAPKGLTRHPIEDEITRLRSCVCRLEVTGIVGCAELIESGIPFAGLDIIESSDRGRFLTRGK